MFFLKMDINKALRVIKSGLKANPIETNHFIGECEAKNLSIEEVREIIQKNKIIGIVEQDIKDNLYKIWTLLR